MANLIIKPTSGGSLILQDEGGDAALTVGTTGSTTLAGTANNVGTVTAGTYSSTISSAATFPTGHIIKAGVLYIDQDDTSTVSGTNTSYADSGIAGTITTVKASSASRLVFKMNLGMQHVPDSQVGQSTMTLRASSSSTTYAAGDDLVTAGTSYRNYVNGGLHKPRHYEMHFIAGSTSSRPANLSAYTAGQTLYARWFFLINGGTYNWIHGDAHASFTYEEIAL